MKVVLYLEDICSRTHGGFPPPKLTTLVPKLLHLKIEKHGWVYQFIICLIYFIIYPSIIPTISEGCTVLWRDLFQDPGGFPPPNLTSLVPKIIPLKILDHGWVYQLIICFIYVIICPITPQDLPHQFWNKLEEFWNQLNPYN